MTLHLLKMCVGIDSVEQLENWQTKRLAELEKAGETPEVGHWTRNFPKRTEEILDGGSLYWVIKGAIRVRQRIRRFERITVPEKGRVCRIVFEPELVRTVRQPRDPMQGWRYLDPADAPKDYDAPAGDASADMPAEMVAELRALGLL
jgi:hypothetical protein